MDEDERIDELARLSDEMARAETDNQENAYEESLRDSVICHLPQMFVA